MTRKQIGIGASVIVGAIALLIIGDMLIVTDEERIEALVDSLAGPVDANKIDAILTWTNPEVQPVEVNAYGRTELFRDAESLKERARSGALVYQGQDLKLISSGVTIEGDVAQVTFRLFGQGFVDGEATLLKRGDDWWISRAYIH
ncbi:MAG: hypothetical protein AAGF12_36120 [Myxococcota bacterium]